MERFLNIVRSNNMVQAVLCIVLGLFLLIYPSITVQGIILLFAIAMALVGASSLVSYFRQRSARQGDTGVLMAGVFYLIVAVIAFAFPKVIAGFFSIVLGLVLILCAIVNAVRAVDMRRPGEQVWIAVLIISLVVAIGGVLIIINPFGATMTFVLVVGVTFMVNGLLDVFIEWYGRDAEKKVARS